MQSKEGKKNGKRRIFLLLLRCFTSSTISGVKRREKEKVISAIAFPEGNKKEKKEKNIAYQMNTNELKSFSMLVSFC